MNETELELMRVKIRLEILERVLVRIALTLPSAHGEVKIGANRRRLLADLEAEKRLLEEEVLHHIKDSSTSSLYVQEFHEVIDAMISLISTFNLEARKQ